MDYATTMMKSNGPSHAVGHKSSKRNRYALEREDGQALAVLLARTESDEGGSKQDSADRRVQPEATSHGEDSERAKPGSPGMAKLLLCG